MRRRWAAVGIVWAVTALSACTPPPAPSPTPTGFASAEEAFAAAEATYRAYSDALNSRRVDPRSVPDPDSFLTGEALQDSLRGTSRLREAGLRLSGASRVVRVIPHDVSDSYIRITACIDSSETRVIDSDGLDVTPVDRAPLNALTIDVVADRTKRLIARSTLADSQPCS